MQKFICQSDVKHIITSLIQTITLVLKTDIITNIPSHSIRFADILGYFNLFPDLEDEWDDDNLSFVLDQLTLWSGILLTDIEVI
jgi:hypothetical protein